MTTNRVDLAQMDKMTAAEVSALPVDMLVLLLEEVAGQKLYAKRLDDKISAALDKRYADQARAARTAKSLDTGRVRLLDGEFEVLADLPKKVSWSDAGLRTVEAKLREMGEPVEDYITIIRTVAEGAYTKWPSSLQSMFTEHRTLATGKPSYKIERRAA